MRCLVGMTFVRKRLHQSSGCSQQVGAVVQLQHGERTLRLLGQPGQAGQAFALVGIVEKRFECAFHLFQILPDLLGHMHQHVALGFALGRGLNHGIGKLAAINQCLQTRPLIFRTNGVIGMQHIFLAHSVLHEQQCGSHFQIHLFTCFFVASGRTACRGRQGIQQGQQATLGKSLCLRMHPLQQGLKLLQLFGISFHIGEPAIARSLQAGLKRLQHRAHARQRFRIEHAAARQVAVQTKSLAYISGITIDRLTFCNKEQRIAQETLGNLRRAFHQATHLQVDPRKQLLDVKISLDAMRNQTLDKPDACPPECTRCLRRCDLFDADQRIAHAAKALLGLGIAQKSQQAALELAACSLDRGSQGLLRQCLVDSLALDPRAQIRKKQLPFKYPFGTLQFAQTLVKGEQGQFTAAPSIRHIPDPSLQSFQRIAQGTQHFVTRRQPVLIDVGQTGFQRAG